MDGEAPRSSPLRTLLVLGAIVAGLLALPLLWRLLLPSPNPSTELFMSEQRNFLTDHAKKDGVAAQPSGLLIRHEVVGEGAQPGPSSTVTVHYRGRLIDGTQFDSSFESGRPISFRLDGVIRGWTEGLQLMREGGTAELVIPAELGYGQRGAGGVIPPGATLIFEVQLIRVH